MGKDGGKYVLDNTRLACKACNSRNRNHKIITAKERRRNAQREANRIKWEGYREAQEVKDEEKERIKQRNRAIHNEPQPDLSSFRSPGYSQETKRKLRENYPKSEGRDRNGIPIVDRPVVYDVALGKFRYDKNG